MLAAETDPVISVHLHPQLGWRQSREQAPVPVVVPPYACHPVPHTGRLAVS
jgi:hypothetical protein